MPRYRCVSTLPTPAGKVEWIADDVVDEYQAIAAFRRRYKATEIEQRTKRTVQVSVTPAGATAEENSMPVVPFDEPEASAVGPAPPTPQGPPAVAAPPEAKAEPHDPTPEELGIAPNECRDLRSAGLLSRSQIKGYYKQHGTFEDIKGIGVTGSGKILDALRKWKANHPEAD